ncbi:MAG: glutamine synthetase type III [Lachnospiraceae bacterium]|nr:glutamine synthetase type III [Lachnospiraceae bacterium]
MEENTNVSEFFGCRVFDDKALRKRISKESYDKYQKTLLDGKELESDVANDIAKAMKEWALEHGCTHYTHWFQPMTGITAEKHDAFVSGKMENDKQILEFSGKELIKGEPDASSFPSGGLRATFEARGYTAWDCTSPAFIKNDAAGSILCIPTIFCSYTGEALDKKTPLLRSSQAVATQAMRVLKALGNTSSKQVKTNVGAEQEYFLVDRDKYKARKDLVFSGRTLFGAMPPKGQELEDHYFGSIRERVGAFMRDVNKELWMLGVPAKTQHNEVAPAQHELAPVYEEANIATDHNQLVMETLKKVAERHNLMCILHEKPFAGVNGSGKHNNWSLTTDDGINLFSPGKKPHENITFLVFLMAILKGVDKHADLLRESVAVPGNDLRLGADEAPPAIVSAFLGEQLEDIINQLVETGEAKTSIQKGTVNMGLSAVPEWKKDATDRNRTSPFAFTGNKFEFRMVGSSDSVAESTTVLNALAAESFCEIADELEKAANVQEAEKIAKEIIVKLAKDHRRILFSGNGYSKEWVEEAVKRGLPNITNMVDSIEALTTDKSVKLFEEFGIYTRKELESRAEIKYEMYSKQINIEARTMIDIASKHIIPAIIQGTTELATSINQVVSAIGEEMASTQKEILYEMSANLTDSKVALENLSDLADKASAMNYGKEMAVFYRDKVIPAMNELRSNIDAAEMIVSKSTWPMPSYGDLIFEV